MKFTVLAMYHPAASFKRPRLWADILEDWEHLPESVDHDYIITDQVETSTLSLYALDTETDGSGGLGQWSVAFRDSEDRLCVKPFYGSRTDVLLPNGAIFHNAKYDERELLKNGMKPPSVFEDTMIMAYCLGLGKQAPKEEAKTKSGSDMVGGLGLKYLARRHLGMAMSSWGEVHDNPELVPEYNAKDSVATFLLAEKWRPSLPEHYYRIDMPLLPVLMAMEDRGILVDPKFLEQYASNLDTELAKIALPFNPFATAEVQSYVYGTLGIEPWKFTASGAPSTEAEVLETIADPLVQELLHYKNVYQERNTYAKGYTKAIDSEGRIHTELKQTSTSTGRLSSANPNLQNVVKEGNMRKLFIAADGKKLIRLDYSQLELRVLAAITQDPVMLGAFEKGINIHQATADALGINYDDAKVNNFLTIYGGTPWKIASEFHITIDKAKKFQEDYFKKFPAIKHYMDKQREIANSVKKVTNFFGRTRRLDAMYSSDWRVRQEGEREAINTPVQGAAGEVVKIAMIDLHEKHNAPMILMIHDEILFEVEEKEAYEYAVWLKEYVPTLVEINGVRFPIEVGLGASWFEATRNVV